MSRAVSLMSLLQERACRQPDVTAYTFIDYDVDPNGLPKAFRGRSSAVERKALPKS